MHRFAHAVPLLALGVVVSGCGSSSSGSVGGGPASVTPQQTVTVTAAPPATSVPSSPTAGPSGGAGVCATAALRIGLGSPGGAAGSEIYPLHFVNISSTSCTISGFPGVSYVAPGNGIQVGPGATRVTPAGGTISPGRLAPGAEATAVVQATNYQNFPAAACGATAVSGFRVFPPGNTASAYVAFPAQRSACSTAPTLQVGPVVPGSTGS